MKTYKKILKKIAHFQVKHPFIVLFMVLAITLFLYGGVHKVKTVASLELMMPKEVSEVKAFNELRDNNMGQDMIAIVLELERDSSDPKGIKDIRDPRVIKYIQSIKNLIASNPDIGRVYAVSDFLPYNFSNLNNQAYLNLFQNPLIENYINKDYTKTMIISTTDVSANDPRMKLLSRKIKKDVESIGRPSNIKIKYTGTPIIQQKLGILISRDRTVTQWISTLLVFIITMILFGTFTSALVPIIIVTISVTWLYGLMGYFKLPISTLAGGVAAMVIGIGIDYAIHLMNKFKNERQKGLSIKESAEAAVLETGTALTGASIATILAFLAFLLGSMPEMKKFGILMAIGVGASFILSIGTLPALLILEEKLIHLIRKRIHFGVEGEFSLYDLNEVHPDDYEIVTPNIDELKDLAKKYKICKPKSHRRKR